MRGAEMAGIAMREGPHQRHAVRPLGYPREQAADLHPGHAGLHCPHHAAVLGGRVHLGIESLDLRGPAGKPEPDDRGVLDGLAGGGRRGPLA